MPATRACSVWANSELKDGMTAGRVRRLYPFAPPTVSSTLERRPAGVGLRTCDNDLDEGHAANAVFDAGVIERDGIGGGSVNDAGEVVGEIAVDVGKRCHQLPLREGSSGGGLVKV